jgi:hypothetical protein
LAARNQKERKRSWTWQRKPIIPVLERQRQEDRKLEVSLSYISDFFSQKD